jgi:hypothetical protein
MSARTRFTYSDRCGACRGLPVALSAGRSDATRVRRAPQHRITAPSPDPDHGVVPSGRPTGQARGPRTGSCVSTKTRGGVAARRGAPPFAACRPEGDIGRPLLHRPPTHHGPLTPELDDMRSGSSVPEAARPHCAQLARVRRFRRSGTGDQTVRRRHARSSNETTMKSA